MINRAFASVLRTIRQAQHLSQEELAALAGVHRTYISQLERGLKSPTLETIYRVTTTLQISLSEFFELVEKALDEDFSADST